MTSNLTSAQIGALTSPADKRDGMYFSTPSVVGALVGKGLADRQGTSWFTLTRLGVQVRESLLTGKAVDLEVIMTSALNQAEESMRDSAIEADAIDAGDVEPDLLARIAGLPAEELTVMVFGAWTDHVKAAVLDQLHALAAAEYRASVRADIRDQFRVMVRSYPLDELHMIMMNNFGFGAFGTAGVYRGTVGGYRIAVVRDELHRRALVELVRDREHGIAVQADQLIAVAVEHGTGTCVRDIVIDAIERCENEYGVRVSGPAIDVATWVVTRRFA
jgi:hypothetical protein